VCHIPGPSLQENTQVELNNIPEQIKELLASAGVLNSVPWDASAPSNGESNAYFQTPEDSQSYDWDLSMDTLDDVIEVEQPTSDGSQVSCSKLYCMPQRQLLTSRHCKSLLHSCKLLQRPWISYTAAPLQFVGVVGLYFLI